MTKFNEFVKFCNENAIEVINISKEDNIVIEFYHEGKYYIIGVDSINDFEGAFFNGDHI